MSELRKANTDRAFFLTLTVAGWIDVFTRKDYSEIILESLKYCQENKGLLVYAWVIMPSHIHLVAKHQEGKLNEVVRDLKSYTAKQIIECIKKNNQESRKEWLLYLFRHFAKRNKQNKEYAFWDKTNHPIELFSNAVIQQKIDYIHYNPVAAGLVTDALSYTFSSANRFSAFKCNEM